MRGSSGAKLTDQGDFVLKQDTKITGTRVRDQGIWLHQHDESLVLPSIRYIRRDGYELEKLTMCEIPVTWKEVNLLCEEIIDALDSHLWTLQFDTRVPERVSIDLHDHRAYITELLDDVGLRRRLRGTLHKFSRTIDWWEVTPGRTHGDGIIDNLAYRAHSAYAPDPVLIDPIPACAALPDKIALDVGRVIQSAAGYEVIRYLPLEGDQSLHQVALSDRVDTVLNTWLGVEFNVNEARAALHFSVIHMLRGVRTAQRVAPDRVEPLRNLAYELVEVTSQWML